MSPPAISANSLFSAQAPSVRSPGWVEVANVVVCISKMPPTLRGRKQDPATPGPISSSPISRCQGDVIFRERPPSYAVFCLCSRRYGRGLFFVNGAARDFSRKFPRCRLFFALRGMLVTARHLMCGRDTTNCYGGRQYVRRRLSAPPLPCERTSS